MEPSVTFDRVFNKDDTGFGQIQYTKKVVAMYGRKNSWTKTVEANFCVANTYFVSGNGFLAPLLFIVPGNRLKDDVMDVCDVSRSTVNVASKEFMNYSIFIQWLDHLNNTALESVERPMLLVYYLCRSHRTTSQFQIQLSYASF